MCVETNFLNLRLIAREAQEWANIFCQKFDRLVAAASTLVDFSGCWRAVLIVGGLFAACPCRLERFHSGGTTRLQSSRSDSARYCSERRYLPAANGDILAQLRRHAIVDRAMMALSREQFAMAVNLHRFFRRISIISSRDGLLRTALHDRKLLRS